MLRNEWTCTTTPPMCLLGLMQGQLYFIAVCCLWCTRFIGPLIAQPFKLRHVSGNQGIGSSIRGKDCGYSLILHGQTRSGTEPTVQSLNFKGTPNLAVLFVLPPSSSQVNARGNASVFHASVWRGIFIKMQSKFTLAFHLMPLVCSHLQ
jgi:hypothetical protein